MEEAEERISDKFKDGIIEITQSERERENRLKKKTNSFGNLWHCNKRSNTCNLVILEEEKEGDAEALHQRRHIDGKWAH